MTNIAILDENLDITKVKNEITSYKNIKIFALNYQTYKILNKNGIVSEFGDLYLSNTDKKLIDDISIEKSTCWYKTKSFEPFLKFMNINLGSLIEVEISQYLLKIFKKILSTIRIIEKEKPTFVIFSSSINDFFQKFCILNNISYKIIESFINDELYFDNLNIKFNFLKINFSFKISRNNYFKLKNFFDKIIHTLFIKNKHNNFDDGSILLVDFNTITYKAFLTGLSSLNKNIFLLNNRRPAIWNFKSLQIIRKNKCKIILLDDLKPDLENIISKEIINFKRNLSNLFQLENEFQKIFTFQNYEIWNTIKPTFSNKCISRFLESIERLILLNYFFEKNKISVILEWAEAGQEEKEILNLSNQKKIPSILLQHGMSPQSENWNKFARFLGYFSFPLLSHYQAVWGNTTKSFAIENNHNPNDLLVVGSPRHDDFFNYSTHQKSSGKILFAITSPSGIFTEGTMSDIHLNFENFVKEVCRVSKKLNKQLIIRPHPQIDSLTNTISLIKEIDKKLPIYLNADIISLIDSCDLVITFNNSTIAAESLILNKPTISLQIENWTMDSPIVESNAILSISKIDEVEDAIKKILFDNKLRKNLLENRNKFLNNYFSNQGTASKSLSEVLKNF